MDQRQSSRINDVLYEIHRDITQPLTGAHLAKIAAYSEQHFHRVFAREVGESVHQYIRRIRLEQAASQLMFDKHSPIQDIAYKCGFSSLSSFNSAFKAVFGVTPGRWRKEDGRRYESADYMDDADIKRGYENVKGKVLPKPRFVDTPATQVAYVRHQGYNRSIQGTWQKLAVWANEEGVDFSEQIGIHHSNPAWVPLAQCRYVACVAVKNAPQRRSIANSLSIPAGLHACFDLQGKYGELLPFIAKILEQWLPQSGYKIKTTPVWIRYRKNQFLSVDETFDLTLYLPISLY